MNLRSGIEADEPRHDVLVLGIGNVLWADEGFGVRAVEALHRSWDMPANVSVARKGSAFSLTVCTSGSASFGR